MRVMIASCMSCPRLGIRAEKNPTKAIYEGVDTQGRVLRLIIADVTVQTFKQVAPPTGVRYPELLWTARIGTATAAANEHQAA
jgi:hypothetical protein